MIKLQKINTHNFKSYKDINIDFSDFTIIVGANASGKSNFVRIFKFIKDILLYGIDNAISLQGGIKNLINMNVEKGELLSLSFSLKIDEPWIRNFKNAKIGSESVRASIKGLDYFFEIQPAKKGQGYSIISDELTIKYSLLLEDKNCNLKTIDNIYSKFYKTKTKYLHECKSYNKNSTYLTQIDEISKALCPDYFTQYMQESKHELMLNRISILLPPFFTVESLINIFDFDPKKLKRPCSLTAFTHLEEDGNNIASVLKSILRNKDSRNKFTKILQDILPFINKVSIQSGIDQSISYQIVENYTNKEIYSNFLSDGTVSIIAFIVALYFENQAKILIFEEPERNIHPKLLSKILTMTKEVSQHKQIIFTTHNSEILRNSIIEDIRFIKRDDLGYSIISKPSDNDEVKMFLQNEIGIDDLFLSDLLG